MKMFFSTASFLLMLILTNACSSEGNITPDGGTKTLVYKACSDHKKLGEFRVELAKDFTGVQGQIFDGVTPQNVPDLVKEVGSCRLLKGRKLFCDPACSPGQSCDEKGACIASPKGQDVGTVTITGLKSAVSMTPRAPIYFYTNTGTLAHPGFELAASLQLNATGGAGKAFTLQGWGIEKLVVTDTEILVEKDRPVSLNWTPPSKEGPSKVHIRLNINNHGGAANWIECEADDKGTFSIPAELVTDLFASGVSGFPDVNITRRSVDATDIEAGCVQFVVLSTVGLPVKVPGLTSCSGDTDCSGGQKCKADLTCG